MTREQALQIKKGDFVLADDGRRVRVESVIVRGIANPYFRIAERTPGSAADVSYMICSVVTESI